MTAPPVYSNEGVKEAFVEMTAFVERYAPDSALFFTEVLDIIPLPWQRAVCKDYDAHARQIAIKSGHGVGKGYVIAGLCVHHLICRFPQKTIMTAPSAPQLFNAAWNDVKIFVKKLPPMVQSMLEVFSESIELKASPNESFASARTSRPDQPEAMQGLRSAGYTLFLADEAAGISDNIFEAVGGSLTGTYATMILTGNPTRNSGFFYDAFNQSVARWKTHSVSCYDCAHITPDYIEDKKQKYGEDSAEFGYRVLGEFPKGDEDTCIPAYLVEGARHRDVLAGPTAPVVWGLDCARTGADRSALAKRQVNVLLEPVRTWRIPDLMHLVGMLVSEFNATPAKLKPKELCVDVIGLGAGVVDRLREVTHLFPGCTIRAVNVAESPSVQNADRFLNLRAELWYAARDWFAALDCKITDPDGTLFSELVVPKSKVTSNGKLQIESKAELKKRGKRSPDAADAFVLTFASTASRMLGGGGSRYEDSGLLDKYECGYV